jgi:hypothetical protein
MGQIIKPNFELPYKSLIFNYRNVDIVTVLYDNTGLDWTINTGGLGEVEINNTMALLDQTYYCVIVTPMRIGNNHSIAVEEKITLSYGIKIICTENGNNNITNDGFEGMTVQINFFNL